MGYIDEIFRKGIHLGSVVIPALAIFYDRIDLVLSLLAVAAGLLLVDIARNRNRVFRRFFLGLFGKVLRGKEQEGAMTASTVLVASAALTIFMFRQEVAVSALVFLSVGDTFAALVGTRYGKVRLVSGRTLEGSLAALFSCLTAGVGLMYISGLMGWALTPWGLSAGALAATLAELFEMPLDDNLRIPVTAGLVMELVIPG
ncbi:hypothetical protein CSA37_11690 [Candidatus Fermentibacteria bacterium]|nr:MAG: hypothetical protein CSA37_11690 [Candidatus Fermentibacteria bacterium]